MSNKCMLKTNYGPRFFKIYFLDSKFDQERIGRKGNMCAYITRGEVLID